jgi:hypothetical protein
LRHTNCAVEGWRLHLAIEHRREGIAWVVSAEDHRRDDEEQGSG